MATSILFGTTGADTIIGSDTDDLSLVWDEIIYGFGGADHLYGGGGGDWIWAAPGDLADVFMAGGDGDDALVSFDGDDWLQGDSGADILIANAGDDTLWGGAGVDQLWGGAGADRLVGGHGSDVLVGGEGDDVLYGFGDEPWPSAYDNDVLIGGAGSDTIYAAGFKTVVFADEGDDIVVVTGEATVYGGAGRDWIVGDSFLFASFYGGAGDDVYLINARVNYTPQTIVDLEGASTVVAGLGGAELSVTTGDNADWIEGAANIDAGGGADVIKPWYDGFVRDGAGDDAIIEASGRVAYTMGPGIDVYDLRDVVATQQTYRVYTYFRGVAYDAGYSATTTTSYASQLIYDHPAAVAAGNLDIITDFDATGTVHDITIYDVFNDLGRRQVTDNGPIRDRVWYDDALGTDVTWVNDANGDLLMSNSQGVFAKFIGVAAADMDLAFGYF